jgi:MOSC domain-containing protein YiiM
MTAETATPAVLRAIWIKRLRRGPMDAVTEATLVENRGMLGNANQNGRRQVTIIEEEVWQRLMTELEGDVDPAARRANLMIAGVSLRESRDRLLRIGSCIIDIRGETRPCERMDEALPGLREAMKPDWAGGVFGTIVKGGVIRVGDEVGFAGWADDALRQRVLQP